MSASGVNAFAPSRLVLARERRNTTQRELAKLVDVTDRMIKGYEAGHYVPAPDTLAKIAQALGFPIAFFEGEHLEPIALEAASFRSLVRASAALRNRAVAAGTLALEFHRYLHERFALPALNVPDLHDVGPAAAAEKIRQEWGLGQKPVPHMIHLLERNGVRVFSLSEDCDSIDAFSTWRDGTPFVFLNTRKTAERSIFDAAHELGHLVLHRHGTPQGQTAEDEADTFAANLLLPEHAIRAAAPKMATIATLAQMKQTWRVSVAALGFRLHELGAMSAWHYKHFNIELSRRGRRNEPAPLAREGSAILAKCLGELAAEDGITLRDIAREIGLPVAELRAFSFGMHSVEGGGHETPPKKTPLRLV